VWKRDGVFGKEEGGSQNDSKKIVGSKSDHTLIRGRIPLQQKKITSSEKGQFETVG